MTIEGELGRHRILLDIIPRAAANYGSDTTPTALARAYFDAIKRSLAAKWTEVKEGQYPGPKRTYPALLSIEAFTSFGIAGQYDNVILLYFPDDLVSSGYFYSFFWTDSHIAQDPRGPVTELEKLVDGFTVLASPVGAPARGCA